MQGICHRINYRRRVSLKSKCSGEAGPALLISKPVDVILRHQTIDPFGIVSWKRIGMQSADSEIGSRLTALVRDILAQNSITAAVAPDALLVDIGLTSMDMVNLMLAVEAEFDFTIPQEQITPENFRSVQTLERLVAEQLQAV
jgi:acyl carrier protein